MKSLPFSLRDEPQSWQTVLTNPKFQHISSKKEGFICCCDEPRDVVEQELVQLLEVKFGRGESGHRIFILEEKKILQLPQRSHVNTIIWGGL